uniref:Centrosomal protein 41 n=1 Tax=Sphenodon punctatus TaxID=8508 RepID=A0A8D0L1F9_SPHPU
PSRLKSVGDPFLGKRIPQNPKYQHVKTRLDTGNSLTKYTERLEEIKRNYRYKKDELFKRLKVTTFAQLIIQVASLSDENLATEEIQKLEGNYLFISQRTDLPGSPLQTLSNEQGSIVISGVGELDLDRNAPKKQEMNAKDRPYPDCPFLLLDVRDRDSYHQCHIIGGKGEDAATGLQSQRNPTRHKNAHGKIIILYDDDERLASQAATTMCERGFENLFMLSGGLKVISQKIPEGLITGSFPTTCQLATHTGSARKRAALKVPSPPAETKWRFTTEDLRKIEYYLGEEHLPSDTVTAVRSSQNLPATSSAVPLPARSLSSTSLQSKPWK